MAKQSQNPNKYQEEFNSRFEEMLEALYMERPIELAKLLELPAAEVAGWTTDYTSLNYDAGHLIQERTGVLWAWLVFGQGAMFAPKMVALPEPDITAVLKSAAMQEWVAKKLFPTPHQRYRLVFQYDATDIVCPRERRQALALFAAAEIAAPQSIAHWPIVQLARLFQWMGLKLLTLSHHLL